MAIGLTLADQENQLLVTGGVDPDAPHAGDGAGADAAGADGGGGGGDGGDGTAEPGARAQPHRRDGAGAAGARARGGADPLHAQRTVIFSWPEHQPVDLAERRKLQLKFYLATLVNLAVSTALLAARHPDPSKVEPPIADDLALRAHGVARSAPFERLDRDDSAAGILAYILATALNFVFASLYTSYLAYSARYVVDLCLCFIGFKLRSKLLCTWIPYGRLY